MADSQIKARHRLAKLFVVCVFAPVLLFSQSSFALITGSHGNRPVPDHDHGWRAGTLDVANLTERLGYWEGPPFGGGEFHFLYRCADTDQFNKALKLFAAIDAPKLEFVVHNGPSYSFWLKDNDEKLEQDENRIDWSFTVWDPHSWERLYNNPKSIFMADHPNYKKPVAPPKIDLYIGQGNVLWEKVNVPQNVTLIDKRPGSVDPKFAGKGLVHAIVLDIDTGQPIPDAEVVLLKRQGRDDYNELLAGKADDKGFCQIAGIPADVFEIVVRADGYAPRKQQTYDNRCPEYNKLQTKLARSSYVKGSVTDADGRPLQGVNVHVSAVIDSEGFGYASVPKKSAVTDQQGRFEIKGLPIGSASVTCRAESLHMSNSIFEIYPIPSESIHLIMTGTATVRGKVVGHSSDKVHVHIQPPGDPLGKWGGSKECNDDGTFEFENVPPGTYLIDTDMARLIEGDTSRAKEIVVEAGKTYDVEIGP
jgi:hypothetical protein